MKDGSGRRAVDWGHLALLVVICTIVVAYLLDARATSLKMGNLLLVQPAAIVALVLAAMVLPQCFRRREPEPEDAAPQEEKVKAPDDLLKVGLLAGAFGAMVFSLETVGFDVATFLFTAVGLWVCGERRLWVIGLFSAIFTAAIIYGYQMLVPYPFPLRVL